MVLTERNDIQIRIFGDVIEYLRDSEATNYYMEMERFHLILNFENISGC